MSDPYVRRVAADLRPRIICGGRHFLIKTTGSRWSTKAAPDWFYARCERCGHSGFGRSPEETLRELRKPRQRSVPKKFRNAYKARMMRAAEARYCSRLLKDPDAVPTESRLWNRDKTWIWHYW